MVSICRPVAPLLASKSQSPRGNFQIPREERKNPHVGTKHFLRRGEMKLRRKCFSPTWRIKNNHVRIFDFLRGD